MEEDEKRDQIYGKFCPKKSPKMGFRQRKKAVKGTKKHKKQHSEILN